MRIVVSSRHLPPALPVKQELRLRCYFPLKVRLPLWLLPAALPVDRQGLEHLTNAILFYERAYYLLHNRYNGINLAFLINNRVDTDFYKTQQDKIADMILANRIRQNVLRMCERDWNTLESRSLRDSNEPMPANDQLVADQKTIENEQRFWIQVNKAEAHFGLGEIEAYKEAKTKAQSIKHADWMMKAFTDEVEKLRILLRKYGDLLNPAWQEK